MPDVLALLMLAACAWSGEPAPPAAPVVAADAASGLTIAASGATLTATDRTGSVRWTVKLGDAAPVRALSIRDGRVYATHGKHTATTIDLASGKVLAVAAD